MADKMDSLEVREPGARITDPAVSRAATARRRLMLGAAAAVLPSVVTLPSGAQTAASSNLRCWKVGMMDRYMGGDIRFNRMPDGWLRKRVYSGSVVNSVFLAHCTTWDQDNIVQINSKESRPRQAVPGTRWAFDGPVLGGQSMTAGLDAEVYAISASPDLYAMVYVDATGSVHSLEPDDEGKLRPVRETCFASLIGSQGTALG